MKDEVEEIEETLNRLLKDDKNGHSAINFLYDKIKKLSSKDKVKNESLAKLHNLMGTIFFKRGELTEAINSFENAYIKDPDNVTYLHNIIKCYLTKGQDFYQEARIYAEKALEKHPHDYSASMVLAVTHFLDGNYRSANRYLKDAIQNNKDKAPISIKFMPIYNEMMKRSGNLSTVDKSRILSDGISLYSSVFNVLEKNKIKMPNIKDSSVLNILYSALQSELKKTKGFER